VQFELPFNSFVGIMNDTLPDTMAFDPLGKRDRYTNYFQNNRNIALISHDYSIENPRHFKGYGDDAWAVPSE
jgi:hypothetical protein